MEYNYQQIKNSKGFSLLELLVVLMIIGIIISVAILALGNVGQTRKAQEVAREFVGLFPVIEEQAILMPATYGIKVSQTGYSFYRLINESDKKHWQLIANDKLLQPRTWPSGVEVNIDISASKNANTFGPNIIITPSGAITPFQLTIKIAHQHILIIGQANGEVSLARKD